MRCCDYTSKRRTSLSGYLWILPQLAIPIGFHPHTAEPLTKNNEQTTTSTIHNWKNYPSTSKPYNANPNRNESPRCSGTLPTLNIDGATNSSHPQGDSDLLAVENDWLFDEILLNCNSEAEPDIPGLLHLPDNLQEDCGLEFSDEILQQYDDLLVEYKSSEDVKSVTQSTPISHTASNDQGLQFQTFQHACDQTPWGDRIQMLHADSSRQVDDFNTVEVDRENPEKQVLPISDRGLPDQDQQTSAQMASIASRLSTSFSSDSQKEFLTKQHQASREKANVMPSKHFLIQGGRLSAPQHLQKQIVHGDFPSSDTPSFKRSSEDPSGSRGPRIDCSRSRKDKLLPSFNETWGTILSARAQSLSASSKCTSTQDSTVSTSTDKTHHETEGEGLLSPQNKALIAPTKPRKGMGGRDWAEGDLRGPKRAATDLRELSPSSARRLRLNGPTEADLHGLPSDDIVAQSSNVVQVASSQDISSNVETVGGNAAELKTLLAFEKMAEALSLAGRLKSRESFIRVMQHPDCAEYVARMKHLAPIPDMTMSALRAILTSREEAARLWPIMRRVRSWMRSIIDSSDDQIVSAGCNMTPSSKDRQTRMRRVARSVRIITGRKEGYASLDMTSALALHRLFRESADNTLLSALYSAVQRAWRKATNTICQRLNLENEHTLTDMEPLISCALIYAIVTENIDFLERDLTYKRLGSKDFVILILSHAIEYLSGKAQLKMSHAQLRDLKEKCNWIAILSSETNESTSLARDENETIIYTSNFHLERVARLFKSIETVSTTVRAGHSMPKEVREVIRKSNDLQFKEYLEELRNILAISKVIETVTYGDRNYLKEWEKDLLTILRRYQVWMEVLTTDVSSDGTVVLNTSTRNKIRDFTDLLGLFKCTLAFPVCVEATEKLLPLVSKLLSSCRASNLTIYDDPQFEGFLNGVKQSRRAQELLAWAVLYNILTKSLDPDNDHFHDYSVLEEEDIIALCNQAEIYLDSVGPITVGWRENNIKLPEAERKRINERLRRDYSELLRP